MRRKKPNHKCNLLRIFVVNAFNRHFCKQFFFSIVSRNDVHRKIEMFRMCWIDRSNAMSPLGRCCARLLPLNNSLALGNRLRKCMKFLKPARFVESFSSSSFFFLEYFVVDSLVWGNRYTNTIVHAKWNYESFIEFHSISQNDKPKIITEFHNEISPWPKKETWKMNNNHFRIARWKY